MLTFQFLFMTCNFMKQIYFPPKSGIHCDALSDNYVKMIIDTAIYNEHLPNKFIIFSTVHGYKKIYRMCSKKEI